MQTKKERKVDYSIIIIKLRTVYTITNNSRFETRYLFTK